MNTTSSDALPDDELQREALVLSTRLFDDDDALTLGVDELHARVLNHIVKLLSTQPERLMSLLYRIDVREDRVKDIMSNAPVGSIATQLSDLIIDRMREKILTREKYRRRDDSN